MVPVVKMGRRGTATSVAAGALCFLALVVSPALGSANPAPFPNPASPLTGPGVSPTNPGMPKIIDGPKDTYLAKEVPGKINCNAIGDPPPNITWYQNGRQIIFTEDEDYHRMLLQNGQLFFLRVIHTKTDQPDVGTYYCQAKNVHGIVKSEPAVIKVAVLRDDFRQEPVDTTKSVHSTAILHCKPPRGEPKPAVSWQHNGRPVKPDTRVEIQDDGDLVISRLSGQDAGEYACVAKNKAGERKSSVAHLTVHEMPEITQYPEDVIADEGEMVEFHCAINNDPLVKWGWKRDGGPANQKKWRMLPGGTLRIENVQASDAGVYVCTAENEAGSVEAVAHLRVEYTPTFLVRPRDQTVAAGRTVSLQCSAEGNPPPTIIWKTNKQELVFVNQQLRRFSQAEDGTLRIEKVGKQDEGEYLCQAINSKGDAQSPATITVRENDFRPPPVIRFGPQNQTLQQDGVALLRCQATGSPQPMIRWLKHGRPLQMTDARYTPLDSGTLQISSLKVSDTGRYTCMAVSETGETTLEATLIVGSQSLGPSEPRKTPPDLTMFPGSPEKPTVGDVTNTTVRLSWQQLRTTELSPIGGYQVEYFGYGSSETWEIAGDAYTSTDVTIEGLLPNTTYVFLVRAKNAYGTGGPSPLSDLVRTLEKGEFSVPKPQIKLPLEQIEKRLRKVNVKLVKVETINASAIRIMWHVKDEMSVVDSFVVQFSHIMHMGDRHKQRYGSPRRKPVPYRPLSYTITGLDSYEYYEICVMAAGRDKLSPCSQPWKIQSGESVPSSPPENVVIERVDDTSVLVSWSPPSLENRKGEITGYQIQCFSEDGAHNCSRSVNGTVEGLLIDDLVEGVNYHISLAAKTEKGLGKWSSNYNVGGPEEADFTKKPWFIGTIIAIGCLFWIALCLLVIWLVFGRNRPKTLKEQWKGSSGKNQERNGNVVRKGFNKDGTFQDSGDSGLPPEFSTLLSQSQHDGEDAGGEPAYNGRDGNHPEMKTFYQAGPVSPYATTTLLQAQTPNTRKPTADQMFRPIAQSYHQHSGGSGDSNTDRSNTTDVSIEMRDQGAGSTGDSGHLTDENGHLLKQHRKGCRPGVPQNTAIVNWNDVLPPPPTHPPNDGEFLVDDQLYSEIPEERAKSPMSPMSQMSACSCPVSHAHQVPGYNLPVYTDNCNRCQSLRNFDGRPYSPQQILHLQRQAGFARGGMGGLPLPPGSQRGGTPVYLHGYSQPWDCQPLPRGPFEYDHAQPPSDGYNYTQPIQDGLIEHANTLRIRDKNRNIPPAGVGPHGGEFSGEIAGTYPGQFRDLSNTPGGPPGNYCEGPCKSQVDAMNNYNKTVSDSLQQQQQGPPNLDSYRIESPPSSGSEYKVLGGGGGQPGGVSSSGGHAPSLKGHRSSSEGAELKERQYPTMPEGKCRPNLFHSRSESSPSGHGMMDEGYSRHADSPVSEDPDYAEGSEVGTDQHTNERDSMVANWESQEDCSSVHSSSSNASSGGQFLTEEDFASAVAHAAQMSGLTVVGTTVSDPNPKPGRKGRHRRQARPPSPGYSTDSNYGTADMVHRPYPKSQRRKHLAEQGGKPRSSKGDNSNTPLKADNTNITPAHGTNTPVEAPSGGPDGEINKKPHNNQSELGSGPTSPAHLKYPSLYRDRPTEGSTVGSHDTERKSKSETLPKMSMFQFSEDIPVV